LRRRPPAAVATASAASSAAAAAEVAGTTAVVLRDLGGGPPKAGPDLVGDDFDLRPLLAVVGLPRPLLQAAGDDDPRALRQRLAGVLGHLSPAHDVEERHRLAALVRLPVGPDPVDGEAEGRGGLPRRGEPQFGVAGD